MIEELRAIRQQSPEAPGVYVFLDRAGRPIYVGKSVNLKARLASYLGTSEKRKETRIARAAAAVEIERTGSEFEALLREVALIQQHRPRFNRRMRSPERYVYVGVDYTEEFPLVSTTSDPSDDGAYFGPFLQRRRVREIVDALSDAFALRTCTPLPAEECWRRQVRRCTAPCVGGVAAGDYGRQFLLVREALAGRSREALRRLRDERDRHAAADHFEAAGNCQRRIRALEGMNKVLYASALRGSDALIVHRAVDDEQIVMWVVVGGEVRASERGARSDVARLARRLCGALSTPVPVGPIAKLDLDRRCIVHAWLRKHGGDAGVIALDERSTALLPQLAEEAAERIAPRQRAFA